MTLTNLISQTRYFATGDSSSSDYSDTDVKRQLNSVYNQLIVLAFSESGEWQFRGNNKQATSITAATRSYALPTSYLRINRVEIKHPSTGEYKRAEAIDYKTIEKAGLDNYTTSVPQYDLKGGYLEIFLPVKTASISAVTDGILIYYENEITELSAADSEPDIPEPFSRLMALMAAYDYCLVEDINNRGTKLKQEIIIEEQKFREFIANRNEGKRLRINFKSEDYGQTGLPGANTLRDVTFN